jgi:RNA polymerase sigma-70 factor, ECF subfamily
MFAPALSISSPQTRKTIIEIVPVVLIQEIASGNEQALARLYDLTKHIIYNLAFKMLKNQAAAEEIVLEVYFQIWKQAHKYSEDRGAPLFWLITITRSRALDRLRHEKRLKNKTELLEELPSLIAQTESPELASIASERRKYVRAALAQLTPVQREVLTLAFYFGLTQIEIANLLGSPLGTVKTRIRCGLLKLKRTLGQS